MPPNADLMNEYGTEVVYLAKIAGGVDALTRLGMGAFWYQLARKGDAEAARQHAEAEAMNEAMRELESEKLSPAVKSMKHTRVPISVPANSDYPAGADEGMIRLASVGEAIGKSFAGAQAPMNTLSEKLAAARYEYLLQKNAAYLGLEKDAWGSWGNTRAFLAAGGEKMAPGLLGRAAGKVSDLAGKAYGGAKERFQAALNSNYVPGGAGRRMGAVAAADTAAEAAHASKNPIAPMPEMAATTAPVPTSGVKAVGGIEPPRAGSGGFLIGKPSAAPAPVAAPTPKPVVHNPIEARTGISQAEGFFKGQHNSLGVNAAAPQAVPASSHLSDLAGSMTPDRINEKALGIGSLAPAPTKSAPGGLAALPSMAAEKPLAPRVSSLPTGGTLGPSTQMSDKKKQQLGLGVPPANVNTASPTRFRVKMSGVRSPRGPFFPSRPLTRAGGM